MKGTWLNNLCSPIFPHIKCEHLSCTVDPKPGIVLQMQLQMCQTEKETIVTLALLLLLKPMMQLASITTWAHCLFIIPACPGLPAKLLCLGDAQSVHLHGLLHPRQRTLHCLCQISPHFCQAILSSISGCLSVATWPPVQQLLPLTQCQYWHRFAEGAFFSKAQFFKKAMNKCQWQRNISHNKSPIIFSAVDYPWRSAVQTTFTHFVAHPSNSYFPNLATSLLFKKKKPQKTHRRGRAAKMLLKQTNKPKTKSSKERIHGRAQVHVHHPS